MVVHITSLEGNRQRLDGGAMFGNAPRPMWEKWLAPDALGRIELACRCLLIETDNKKILCEAGIGAFFEPKLAERYGVQTPDEHRLLSSLAAKGIKEEEIDYVILSHLHFDHAGGLLPSYKDKKSGAATQLLFPKAQYIVGEEALNRNLNPHLRDRASFIPELYGLLEKSSRLAVIPKGGKNIPALGQLIEFVYTDGHTPGHMHTLVQGDQGKAFFCGDLIPGSAWLHIPITMGYDRFPEKLIDEKTIIYQRAIPEKWLLFFTHDHQISAATCIKDAKDKITMDKVFNELHRYSL